MKNFNIIFMGFIAGMLFGIWMAELFYAEYLPTAAPTAAPEARYTFYTLEKMYDAIRFVESTDGQRIYGLNGEVGDYQLKKIYVDDVNRIQRLLGYDGDYMSYDDRYDTVKSRRATGIVTSHYASATWKDKPHTSKQYIETAARAHHRPADRNNSKTDEYWAKIKARMESRIIWAE